jgi:hypothetical protein
MMLVRITRFGAVVVVLAVLLLVGCGSTKVYTADKTVVYQESVYNVSNVKVFTRRSSGQLADQSMVNLANVDEAGFMELLVRSPSIRVRQGFMLDEIEMLYQQGTVSSWKEFKKLNKRFNSASKDLNKFLADSKKTQLRLK